MCYAHSAFEHSLNSLQNSKGQDKELRGSSTGSKELQGSGSDHSCCETDHCSFHHCCFHCWQFRWRGSFRSGQSRWPNAFHSCQSLVSPPFHCPQFPVPPSQLGQSPTPFQSLQLPPPFGFFSGFHCPQSAPPPSPFGGGGGGRLVRSDGSVFFVAAPRL